MSSKKRSSEDSSALKSEKKKKKSQTEKPELNNNDSGSGSRNLPFLKLSSKLRKSLLDTKYGENDELREIIGKLSVLKCEVEHSVIDKVVKHDNIIDFQGITLHRTSTCKDGGDLCYTATANNFDLLGRRRNAKMNHLLRIRYSFNENLKKVYDNFGFVNVSDELFLEFVIHVITVVMDQVSENAN